MDNKTPVILIIDDEEMIRRSYRNFLEDRNYSVLEAENGRVGLDAFWKYKPDAVLLDLRMPEIDGLEVLASIAKHSPDTPVIIISGAGDFTDAVEALRLGAWDYLIKPVETLNFLTHSLEKVMERSYLIRKNREHQEHLEEKVERRTEALKKTSDALRESEEKYRSMMEAMPDPVYICSSERRITFMNQQMIKRTGYDACGEYCYNAIYGFDTPCSWCIMDSVQNGDCCDQEVVDPGTGHYYHVSNSPIFHGDDSISKITISVDITHIKQAEEALRQYENIVDTSKDHMAFIDNNYVYQAVNNMYVKAHEKPRKDILGHSVKELLGDDVFNNLAKPMLDRCLSGEEIHDEFWFDYAGLGIRCMEVSYYPFRDSEEVVSGIIATSHDITARKKAEEQRLVMAAQNQKVQKMKAIGALAGGIAHQFNNALNGLLGNAELLEMIMPENSPTTKYTNRMKASIDRMAELTSQLLAYARGGKYQPQELALNKLVENTLHLIKNKIPSSVKVDIDLPDNLFKIEADHTQMQIVLSAMVMNASDAIEGDGLIRIGTKNIEVTKKSAKNYPELSKGFHVCLTVEDSGKGMDKETQDRLFEPFFTTNFQGRGLGMAAVYGIVANHSGHIIVNSKLEKGTSVKIYFPAINIPYDNSNKKKGQITKDSDSSPVGNILMIEDDEAVTTVTRTMIEKLGYHVLSASTGKEAIDIAHNHDISIDLALLDISLPDMGGSDVYPLLMEARPGLKVVLCSGLSIEGLIQDILDAGADGYIQKPYSFKTLSEKLQEVIERRKKERFHVETNAVAISANNSSIHGQIIDISEGGLSFCVDTSEDFTLEFAEFAIEVADKEFNMQEIPCEVVSLCRPSDAYSLNDEEMKRMGVRFGDLSSEQRMQLEYFIKNYAITNTN